MNIIRALRVSALYLFGALAQQLPAQISSHVVGEVTGLPAGESRFQVEIHPLSGDRATQPHDRVFVEMSGRFQFARVPHGQYEFLLMGPDQNVIHRELVTVGDFSAPVQLRYRQTARLQQPGGPVSMARLRHKVPKAAAKAYRAAGKHRDHKRNGEAEAGYREAIAADPEFLEALNDLATLYYATGRFDAALQTLESARRLYPTSAPVLANQSAALLALQRPVEAEALARQAVALDSRRIRSRYLLGLSRAAQNKTDEETRILLEEAADVIPKAHLALAYLYNQQGEPSKAQRHQNMFNSLR